jgi:hypothetical protein
MPRVSGYAILVGMNSEFVRKYSGDLYTIEKWRKC